MLLAVDHCHTHNIVHRDLKPENFLFTHKGDDAVLKIIDFGLSCGFEEGQVLASRVGTPYVPRYVLVRPACQGLTCMRRLRVVDTTLPRRCWRRTTPASATSGVWVSSCTSCCVAIRRSGGIEIRTSSGRCAAAVFVGGRGVVPTRPVGCGGTLSPALNQGLRVASGPEGRRVVRIGGVGPGV